MVTEINDLFSSINDEIEHKLLNIPGAIKAQETELWNLQKEKLKAEQDIKNMEMDMVKDIAKVMKAGTEIPLYTNDMQRKAALKKSRSASPAYKEKQKALMEMIDTIESTRIQKDFLRRYFRAVESLTRIG